MKINFVKTLKKDKTDLIVSSIIWSIMFFYIYIETNLILQLVALAWVILDIRSFYKEYKIGLAIKLKVDNNASKNEIHDFIDNHLPKVLYLSIFENILTIIFIGIVSWKQIFNQCFKSFRSNNW